MPICIEKEGNREDTKESFWGTDKISLTLVATHISALCGHKLNYILLCLSLSEYYTSKSVHNIATKIMIYNISNFLPC